MNNFLFPADMLVSVDVNGNPYTIAYKNKKLQANINIPKTLINKGINGSILYVLHKLYVIPKVIYKDVKPTQLVINFKKIALM